MRARALILAAMLQGLCASIRLSDDENIMQWTNEKRVQLGERVERWMDGRIKQGEEPSLRCELAIWRMISQGEVWEDMSSAVLEEIDLIVRGLHDCSLIVADDDVDDDDAEMKLVLVLHMMLGLRESFYKRVSEYFVSQWKYNRSCMKFDSHSDFEAWLRQVIPVDEINDPV